MESSIFFKSKVSGQTYLYDFNTCLLTAADPMIETIFNIDKQIEKTVYEKSYEQKEKQDNKKKENYYRKKYQYLKKYGLFGQLTEKYCFPNFTPNTFEAEMLNTQQIIFEVTDSCNLNCKYCGYGDLYNNHDRRNTKSIDLNSTKILLDYFIKGWQEKGIKSNKKNIYISFYGGEPLINMVTIKQIISYIEANFPSHITPSYSMTTNGSLLNEHIEFLINKKFQLLISLDGNEYGNSYRRNFNDESSFGKVYNIAKSIKYNYPTYFNSSIEFNTVLHDRNSVESLLSFFQKEFNKIPSLSALNHHGVSPNKKEVFNEMYKSAEDNFKTIENRIEIEEKYFLKNSQSTTAKTFSTKYLDNSYYNHVMLLQEKENSPRYISNGSCIPFSRRILMTVNNKLLPCERIGHNNPFGYIKNNQVIIDTKRINEYSKLYNTIKTKCAQCYLYKNCPTCMYSEAKDDFKCTYFTDYNEMKETLADYISIFEEHRDYYKRFVDDIQIL